VKGIGIAEYDIRKYAKAFTDSKIRSGDWRNPPKMKIKKKIQKRLPYCKQIQLLVMIL
jgi:hypothetical protein